MSGIKNLTNAELLAWFEECTPDAGFVTFVTEHGGTAQDIWDNCPRAEWLIFLLNRMVPLNRAWSYIQKVKVALFAAKQVAPLVKVYETEVNATLETIEDFLNGTASEAACKRMADFIWMVATEAHCEEEYALYTIYYAAQTASYEGLAASRVFDCIDYAVMAHSCAAGEFPATPNKVVAQAIADYIRTLATWSQIGEQLS
jgi:hypothetical protein